MESLEFGAKSHFSINPLTPEDVLATKQMHARSWIETYPNAALGITKEWIRERMAKKLTDEAIAEQRERVRGQMGDPNHLDLAAKDDNGEVIGLVHAYRNEEGKNILGALYTDSRFHGSGLAKDLMDKVIAWSDADRPIFTSVATYNERARRFYEKMGFREIPNSEHLFDEKIPEIDLIREV